MRIRPKQSDSPMVIRKKMLPRLRPKMTPEMKSCTVIGRLLVLPATRSATFLSSGSSVPQMPFSPASMMNTSTKPITSSQLPNILLSTSFMPV